MYRPYYPYYILLYAYFFDLPSLLQFHPSICNICTFAGLHTGFFSGGGGGGDLTEDLRVYMRRCHAYNILVNKSHNNAVITNDFFLLVYVIILLVLYILDV